MNVFRIDKNTFLENISVLIVSLLRKSSNVRGKRKKSDICTCGLLCRKKVSLEGTVRCCFQDGRGRGDSEDEGEDSG